MFRSSSHDPSDLRSETPPDEQGPNDGTAVDGGG
jgi:hypothetical protein